MSSIASSAEVSAERIGAVLWVEIKRPAQRNALSLAVLGKLGEIFTSEAADQALTAAVVTGSGDRSFAAGGDLKELDSFRSRDAAALLESSGRSALDAIREFPVPVIAAVNGPALGGGAELAVSCDLRIAASTATIGFLQSKLAITTAWGGAADLVALLGFSRATALLLSAEVLAAEQAHAIGLFNCVVSSEGAFRDAVLAYAGQWSLKAPHVIRALTTLVRRARRTLRAELHSTERTSFIDTWVDPAHWSAAAGVLVKPA